ncbi:putative transcriptional regulator [Neolewinella xylanilytica]|uniref:Putative transcriptional regulator n=1 Tax=Neolewinella xylanilytica TaxID=1514080 RepID=A0A2S6IA52_9BACT|nr:helix-turn-helix transcriptional regulator [Neolewinella xylanilytica]PPK88375.1 putative transcriptional regulator [Neolewinella xylanilytica]
MTNQLKVERARHDLSQAALAARVGVSRQTINAVETGRFVPSTLLALKIARVLNSRVDDLFALEADELEKNG